MFLVVADVVIIFLYDRCCKLNYGNYDWYLD